MNIIANNCIGARLYEVTKQQFPNPFMWMTYSSIDDFIDLVENYDSIDLQQPIFELETYNQNKYKTVLVTLNNHIKLHYIHYIQDDTKLAPVKELNTNILYNDILTYAKTKWFARLKRNIKKPIFLYSFNYLDKNNKNYIERLNKLLNINTKYKFIILIHNGIKFTNTNKNINVIQCDDNIMNLNGTSLANNLKKIIFKKENEYNM